MMYLLGFGVAFALVALITPVVRRVALHYGIIDRPSDPRKIHRQAVAYLGGVAIFIGFAITALALVPLSRQLVALLLGCLILVAVGAYDDARGLSPQVKLAWQFVAAGVALAGGIGITSITNPFGGVIDLTWGRTEFNWFGWRFHIMPLANSLSLLWMVGLANTINFLDGLDGLASGVSGIAGLVIFGLAIGLQTEQPAVAMLAIIVAGAAFGFLPHNFFPARIFMGDSGAYFLGLVLAMLAVYSGAKLATAALVLGVPIIDSIWVAARRIAQRRSPFRADRQHFHHLLLDAGLSQRRVVLLMYGLAALFGGIALTLGSLPKFVLFLVLVGFMMITSTLLIRRSVRRLPDR